MSLGTVVGGVVGAVVGFSGGPYGAFVGASIGMAVGSMVDPITPDMPTPGKPNVQEITINTAEEGGLIPEVLGTVKLGGNIVWHGGEPRVVEIKETQESGGKGGGGGSQEVTKGYEYYLDWVLVFCMGPIDTIYTIIENDEIVWSHTGLDRPGSGGMRTITIDSKRTIDFYYGTDDQTSSSYLNGKTSYNLGRRYRCYAVFKDYFIGEYPRCPNIQICIKSNPDIAALDTAYKAPWGYDYNPVHAKYYMLDTMIGRSGADLVDTTSWDTDAATLYNEGRGVSILFAQQRAVADWWEQIDQHIFGGVRLDVDGKFEHKLLRGSESTSSMISLNADEHCLELPQFKRNTWLDVVNEVKVQHPLRLFEEVCECNTCGISASTHQLDFSESLNLSASCSSGDANKCNFTWELGGGLGGSLSTTVGDSTTYTAPGSNNSCGLGHIRLLCNGLLVDTWTISVTDYDDTGVAYIQINHDEDPTTYYQCIPFWGYWPSGYTCPTNKCCCWCHYRGYDCRGLETTYYHGWPCGFRPGQSLGATVCSDNTPPYSINCGDDSLCESYEGDTADFRGQPGFADEGTGCCPWEIVQGG